MKTFDKKTGNETKRFLGVLAGMLALGMTVSPVQAYVYDPVTQETEVPSIPSEIHRNAVMDQMRLEEIPEETTQETVEATTEVTTFEAAEVATEVTTFEAAEVETSSVEEEEPEEASQAEEVGSSTWDGPVLTAWAGVVEGPSGRETYYNLDMTVVVDLLRSQGYTDEYWVREDGCKMFGDYIMCAANYDVHPFGSLVESSLGTCIVCDTGGFAAANPTQLDIATTW